MLPLQRDFDASSLTRTKPSITRSVNNQSSKTSVEIPNLSLGAYMQRQYSKRIPPEPPPNDTPPPQALTSSSSTNNTNNTNNRSSPNNDNNTSSPCPLPGHAGHTIAQCRQRKRSQAQADSTNHNSLPQAPLPSTLRNRSNITPTSASGAQVTETPPASSTPPTEPLLSPQDTLYLDTH